MYGERHREWGSIWRETEYGKERVRQYMERDRVWERRCRESARAGGEVKRERECPQRGEKVRMGA